MRIKLEDISTKKNNSTELSTLSYFDEMVERKTTEIMLSHKDNFLAIPYIELVFFFDSSSSVSGTETTMCKYLRKMIHKYKQSNLNILFTFITFSSLDEVKYYRCPLNQINELDYRAGGDTALYDCLFKDISNLVNQQIDINGIASKTIVTIMTDGMDNSSKLHSEEDVKKLVEYTKSLGWEYIFLLKDNLVLDSFIGIDIDHIGIYNDFQSIKKCFHAMDEAIKGFIFTGTIDKNWKSVLDSNVLKLTKKGD